MGKKNIFKKIKDWIVGKDSKVKEANRVTNYGGGVSSKSVQKEVKRSIVKAEAKKRGEKQTKYQQSAVSKSSSSAFKATPPSVRKAEAKDRQTSKKSDPFNAKNAFKASAQPKFSHQSTALGTMSSRDTSSRIAKMNAYNENRKYQSRAADKLKPLIDEKYSTRKGGVPAYIKQGNYAADPDVAKYNVLKHPIATSATRGGLSGATFGLSELGIALLPKSKEAEEAERFYQANKSKGAEFAGEMAGSLLGFGLTSGASKAAVTKLAPKTTARLGESATEIIAKNGLVRRAAEKEALRKLGTTATKEEIEHFARARAAKLVAALGEDAAINLTTGAVSDVSHAIIDSDNPVEFLKNMGMNAVGNVVLGGVTSAVPALRGGNVDDAFVRNRLAAREGLDDLMKRNRIGINRTPDLMPPKVSATDRARFVSRANKANQIDEGLERINIRDMAKKAEPKAAESLAKNSDTVLGKSVEVPSEDIIKSGEGNYGGIPIKYAPKEHSEASSWGSEIHVSDKFFQQDAATQKHILNHEIAHNWSDDFMSEHTGDWQDFTAKFVKEKEVPPSSTAYANGQRTYYEGLYGDIGATSLSETTTRAITEYLDDPDALLKRSPEAYEAVEEFVERRIGARPSAQNIDAQVDDALDELIESATTTEDFMNFFGLDRATAEILAKDKAEQASRKAVSAVEEATQNGIPKGNIKPLAENLRTNKEIPRSRNREWRATPRSAKRVDTSIEGITKQLDELKGKSWKTDRERRAIETKINDVEDRLNRAKWRREGGADMQAMRKAYRGEYAGFDMGKYTNSHQSDALEGKLKGKTATIVEMSPDEYMERAYRQIFKKPTERGEAFSRIPENQKDIEKYAEAMRNGEQFPLPYLDYSAAQQEGRHRALAAKAAGIDKIPVVIIDDEANPKAIINEVAEATAKAETPKVEAKAEAPKVEAEELPKPEAESLKETAQKRADEVMGAEYKEQKPKTKEIPEKTKKAADKKADSIRAELAKEDIDPSLKAENPEDNIRAALAEDKTKARAKEEKISKGQAAVREAYEEQTGESWKVGKNGFESDADKRATFDQLWDARKEYHQSQGRETERKLSKYASTQVRVASKERADYIIDNIIKHSQDAEYDVLHHEEVYREVAENLEKDWDTWVNKLSDVADGGDWGGKDTPKLLATAQFLGELIDDVPRTPETDALAKIAYLAGQKLTTSSAQTMNFRRHFAHLSPASKLDVIMDDLAKTLDNAQGFNKKHAKGLKGLNHWERLDYIKGQLMDDPKLKDAVEKMVYAKTPEELDVMKRRNEGLISQIEGLEKQKAELEKKLKAAEAKAKASGKATLPQDVDEMAQIKDLDVEIEGLNTQKQILDSQIEKAEKANVDPDELTKAQAKVIRAFNKHNAKTGYDVVQELRYIAMLLNPKTHIRNVGGSGFFSPVRDLSNTIRAGVEEGVYKHYGMEVDVKHGGLTSLIGNTEAGKKATEAINKSEIRNALYGNSKLTELPTQRGRGKTLAGKALDAVSDFSSWTLKKEDDAFKTLAFKKNYIMSYNKYLKDGVPITPKIEAAIEAEAMQEAKIATFNEYNAVANALNKFYKNSTNANASGAMRWAARGTNALMPFTKAPANLMKQSINYSPLGLAKGMYAIKQAGKKGDAQALNRAIDELSSGVTGTGIYVLGALLGGTTDMFTTNVGKDDLGAKFKKDRGYQNYSVNFVDPETGKGHSFTLDWLVPNSAAFFMGVETANQIKKNGFSIFDVVHAAGDWAQVTSRLAEPVMDTSMLSGLNSMIEGVRGNYNGDDQLGVPHILLRETVQSYLNSLVPSVLGQTTRTLYKTDKQILGDSDWKYWANSTRSKAGLANLDIETLGGALGADTDVYGNVKNDKGKRFTEAVKDKDKAALTEYGKSALKNFFSPANIQKIDMSEVDKEKLAEYEKRVAAGEDPSELSYLFPKKAGEWQRNFSYGYGDEDDAGNKTDIKMTNKEISLYNKAKAKGGAEGMRAALSNYIFHRFDADEKGHYTIPHDDNITPEETEKLIKKFEGKSIREVEQWLYQDPRFKKANKAEQKQVLEDLWKLDGTGMATGSRREGERAVIKARGGDLVDYDYKNETPERVQKNLQEALDKGIVTAEQALDFTRNAVKYGYYPSADGKGGGTVTPYYNKKEMMEYLAKSGYSYEECEALYNAFRKKGSKEFSGIDLSSGGWHGYGYRRWHRWGSYQRKGRKPSNEMPSGFKAKKSHVSSGGSNVSAPNVSGGINTKSTASRMSTSPKINITPLNIKTVRASSSKASRGSKNLAAALEDIQRTEKKVKPPKARR